MMQVVPNLEMTIGDTVEFELNGNIYQSKITNSCVDNNLIVWVDEFSIALDNVKNPKCIKCGPWHDIICKFYNSSNPETNTIGVKGLS